MVKEGNNLAFIYIDDGADKNFNYKTIVFDFGTKKFKITLADATLNGVPMSQVSIDEEISK